jgi:hypothetical protein
MAALEKGITRNGEGFAGKTWNILGQVYFPKAVTDSTFAFETNSEAFRMAISTNRTSLLVPCSGCHPPGSWRRCSTNSITLRMWPK